MFRLIKLALYAVLGYALYELYVGMTEQGGQGGGMRQGQQRQGGGASRRASAQNMTGGGQGMKVQSEEASGTSVRHTVGRGVELIQTKRNMYGAPHRATVHFHLDVPAK